MLSSQTPTIIAKNGKMPGSYTLLHPEMRLSSQDVEMICAATRPAEAAAGADHNKDFDNLGNGVIPR